MRNSILGLVLKKYLNRLYTQWKYDVNLYRNAYTRNTKFGGRNIVRENVIIRDSDIGFATTINADTKLIKAKVGNYCSIGHNVRNGLGNHPTSQFVSTHPAFYLPRKNRLSYTQEELFHDHKYVDSSKKFYTKIGHDVWIGNNVSLFDGITIGNGVIVGAGAIVTKSVPPFAIVAGVPAKILKYRFSAEQINLIESVQWWEKSEEWIKNHIQIFINIDVFCSFFNNESQR
jgi:acetyltransferase-like isoleucine patch superfamily enzyme